ncbi:O-antigen ligase family protein [Leptolyngbya sp. O-77]|uniref:O-antigen ligase family protein n=1 Tax=Leptolyngbya sp. O-77 TaxID=1080068 RepID=UPI00074D4832|nr:O-antigen ligase family protein [Leptolyngbya sp. O-77]BAU44001.1 O-Antigen ligase [Leptolyngbya sp. O-77]
MSRANIFALLITTAVFLSGFADAFRGFSAGFLSLQGLLTVLAAVMSWFLIIIRGKISKLVLTAPLLISFITLGLVSLLWNASTLPEFIAGFQNLSVYAAFVGFLVLSTTECSKNPYFRKKIGRTLSLTFKLSAMLYGLGLVIAGPGASLFMGARAFALYIILGSAWFLGAWRYRVAGGIFWFMFIQIVLALSFSRMATVISILLFPLSQLSFKNLKDLLRVFLSLVLILILATLAFTYVTPVRERFTSQGDNAEILGIKVNTSGRAEFWEPVYASTMESPLLGKGPGSVAEVVLAVNDTTGGHPHNDYLRIFHDFGIIGLLLWLMGYFGLLIKTLRSWLDSDKRNDRSAHIHLSAFLALLAVALAMLTDNIIVYIFTMVPLGVLTGLSLGSQGGQGQVSKPSRIESYQARRKLYNIHNTR